MIDKNTQAILLLSCYFSKAKKDEPSPLTPSEYARYSRWLFENKYMPGYLLDNFEETNNKWNDTKRKITSDRLKYLLGRGLAMSLALEKWSSAGIWIMARNDPDYPKQLKYHLKDKAPAILFGVGNKKLLNSGGLAIVGSRNIDDSDKIFTKKIAKIIALYGKNIVSGGARGVDEIAMLSALESEGTAVGILANSLLDQALSAKWRKYIKNNELVLTSTFYPEAGFNVGNAMARNKYIYCMSNSALVVHSGTKGGTLTGALENLKNGWTSVWVKKTDDTNAGNALIEEKGGHWCTNNIDEVDPASFFVLKENSTKKNKTMGQGSLFPS